MFSEPIAIIGIGCRFPGHSNSPDQFWNTLCEKTDTVQVIPDERFNISKFFHPKAGVEGRTYTKWSALVDDFDKFDASFFGISPREADFIDPQQRLILETSWRALEDAREVVDLKRGRSVGVFAGVSTLDYHLMQSSLESDAKSDIYTATGSVHSIVANRVSYILNLKGPSVAVDTACSSALVAVHQACQSLRNGDSEMALAGGVNSILGPLPYLAFCKMGMLSPTGRCHPFDSRADGFVRGEGAGMVLLKPLSAALRDGNRIYATIAATNANQDGKTNGITVPNALSQQLLTTGAMQRAGIAPSEIAYMEAHGTGTPIGDPIEAHALGMALGQGRKGTCPIGSVKGNIGHLEAGAGAAGIIKAALSLYHRRIPATLHFKKPNPNIDFERLKLRVVTDDEELPGGTRQPYAGVNSFGFGGTNAHAILQAVPQAKLTKRRRTVVKDVPPAQGYVLPISAGSPEAVWEIAGQFRELLDDPELRAADVCLTAATRRVDFLHRAVACGRNRQELSEALVLLSEGASDPRVLEGNPLEGDHPQPVFVFSGQGPQWYAMGRHLLEREPVFRDVIEKCDAFMAPWGDWSLLEELRRDEKDSRIQETAIAQPAIFAVQAALAALWKSRGVHPAAVVGHSVGEVAAAHVAGILTLKEACRVIYWRGACMDATVLRGRMLAVALTVEDAEMMIAPHRGKIHVAAENSPGSVTLSGDAAPLEELAGLFTAKGIFNRFLKVGYAFHSHHMAEAREPLLEHLGEIRRKAPHVPIFSTVTGNQADESLFDADYWWDNVRQPVWFAKAVAGLVDLGHMVFLEISAHPVLKASVEDCLKERQVHGDTVFSLERNADESLSMMRAFGSLHLLGCEVGWREWFGGASDRIVLPEMPFRRIRHWNEPASYQESRCNDSPHNLLQRRLVAANPTWATNLDLEVHAFLKDHVIQNHVVFPAAGYLEAAYAAAQELHGEKPVVIEDVDFVKAMFLPEQAFNVMQLVHRPTDSGFEISSRNDRGADWSLNVKGRLRVESQSEAPPAFDPQAMIDAAEKVIPGEMIYRSCEFVGLLFGPTFKGIRMIHYRPMEVLAEIEMHPGFKKSVSKFFIPPSLLDQCFQALVSAAPPVYTLVNETGFMPVSCRSYRFFAKPRGRRFYCRVKMTHCAGKLMRGDLLLQDEFGTVIASFKGFESQAAIKTKEFRATSPDECLYQNRWIVSPLIPAPDVEVPLPTPVFDKAKRKSTQATALRKMLDRLAAGWISRGGAAGRRFMREAGVPAKLGKPVAFDELVRRFPDAYPEAMLIERAGRSLCGEADAVDGGLILEEHFVQDSPSFREDHDRIRSVISDVLARHSGDTVIDVLVSGAGTGGAIHALLPDLAEANVRMIYLESDPDRMAQAEQKFFDFSFITYCGGSLGSIKRSSPLQGQRFHLALLFGEAVETALESPGGLMKSLESEGLCLFDLKAAPPLWMRLALGLESSSHRPVLGHVVEDASDFTSRLGEMGLSVCGKNRIAQSGGLLVAARGPVRDRKAVKKKFPAELLRHEPTTHWVLFTDEAGALEEAGKCLSENAKNRVVRIVRGEKYRRLGDESYEIPAGDLAAARRLVRELDRRFSLDRTHWVYGWSLDVPGGEGLSEKGLLAAESLTTAPLLALARTMSATSESLPRAFTLLTRAGQSIKTADPKLEPAQALVIGLGRTMISENPRVSVRLVDLDPAGGKREARILAEELTYRATDDEVAYRRNVRYSLRLDRVALNERRATKSSGHRLDILNPGVLDSMTFLQTARRTPKRGEVEVSIRAAALNFRDVMKALGIYPSDQAIDLLVGDECSGVVERVGAGVTRWKPGDRVIALGAGCFGSHITAFEELLLPLPDAMTFEEGATLPVAYMTAVHALCSIAGTKPGEWVLIQAGSGGVGVAAVHLAHSLGARVMATAGSPAKRDFLRGLGVEHVFDSRSLEFAEEVLDATDGRGVDVVLNSLAGAAIEKGISCLAPYGRFVEIGKRDVYNNTPVGLRPLRNNNSMTVVDLGQAMQDGGERLRNLLGEVAQRIAKDRLPALPHRVFALSRAKDAFRCMSQARHIGKIVLAARGPAVEPRPTPAGASWRFDPEGVYIVTGGLSGFGREIGLWMISQGAKNVYLVSRGGKPDEAVSKVIAGAICHGIRLVAAACDVTSRQSVEKLLSKIRSEGRPIRGVIHSAMVLEDKTLANMTPEQMTRVLAPKVRGTWNLHDATLGDPINMFVMFSSVSSLLGSAGQGNYAAANAFLDSMAHYRRSRKLPALTVNWGQLGDVGVAANNSQLKESLTRQGIIPLPFGRATDMLLRLLSNGMVQSGVIPVDWNAFRSTHPQLEKSTRYETLFAASSGGESDSGSQSARTILMETPPARRKKVMHDMLREEIAKVLRSSASKIRDDRPLTQLGLDSLMTFELIVRLEQQFEISLPPARMKEGTTLTDVADHLLELISGSKSAESGNGGADAAEVAAGAGSSIALESLPEGCMVALKKSGDGYPLFMIHPAGGTVSGYDAIAGGLPDSIPAMAIQSRSLLGAEAEFPDFDSMASAYAAAILQRQKTGPVHLFGFSAGSWVAHGIASRIEAAGREVGWLGLVDPMDRILTSGDAKVQEIVDWHTGNLCALLSEFLEKLRLLTPAISRELQPLAVKLTSLSAMRRSAHLKTWLQKHHLEDSGLDLRLATFLISLQIHHTEIGRKAVLTPVRAPVTCWRGRHKWSMESEHLPLGQGSVENIDSPFDHFGFLSGEGTRMLSRMISKRITRDWKRGEQG